MPTKFAVVSVTCAETPRRADRGVYGAASIGEALCRVPFCMLFVPLLMNDLEIGVGVVCIGLPASEGRPGLFAHGVKAGKGTPPPFVL